MTTFKLDGLKRETASGSESRWSQHISTGGLSPQRYVGKVKN